MKQTHTAQEIEQVTGIIEEILKETYVRPEAQTVSPPSNKTDVVARFYRKDAPWDGIGLEAALTRFREEVLPISIKTWHPLFLNQMFPGASFPSIVGDLLASMMNPTLATYEMSPAATVIERTVATWMARFLGMPEGSGGILLPGGSLSNLLALTVARNTNLNSSASRVGLAQIPERGAILCSDACHYSVANAANLLGIGAEQVVKVKTNHRNEMLFDDFLVQLDACEARGLKPFVVVATMGITVTGGYDPLDRLGPVCRERGIHLHVDAAFGGGIALTSAGRETLAGIEYADTVIWDAHKWLHVPLATTVLLVPDPGVLKQVFGSNADYLYHPQDEDIDLTDDLGNYTILCGKRFEALRLWLLFVAYGENHFREMAESRLTLTHEIAAHLETSDHFKLSYTPRSPLVCFRYIPAEVENRDQAWLDGFHRQIRDTCRKRGLAMFNVARLKGAIHFRMILVNPLTELDDLKGMLVDIESVAREILANE